MNKPILINCGAGKTDFGSDWIHIDGELHSHVKYQDIFLNGWADNSVDLIYSSHTLEYFAPEEACFLLICWRNALKPGGTIRLAVPDFDALIKIYEQTGNLKEILGPLYGQMGMNDDMIFHRTCYNYQKLADLLSHVGFKDIKKWDWNITPVDDCSAAHWPHRPDNIKNRKFDKDQILVSLNLEAIK